MPENLFLNLSILLAVTATVAFLVRLLRQPLVVAYLVAGVLVGPAAFDLLGGNGGAYRAFADTGIVLLLFMVGLNFNIRHLMAIGRASVAAGVGQFLFTAVIGFLLLLAFPMTMTARVALAVAITFSSTIVILKLLNDKGDTERLYGRNVIGLMIVQDLIAIVLLVALSVAGSSALTAALGVMAIRAAVLVAAIFLLARFLLPVILTAVAASTEHLFLTTIAWCFGVASAVHLAGFSLELGALVAGMSLAASPYQWEIASRVRPLRDFFLVLFFLVLGATLRFTAIVGALPVGLALSAFILIGNPIILYVIYRRLGFTRRNSFLAGVTAAQVSEFGFILLLGVQRLGYIGDDTFAAFTIAALVTIVGSTYLVTYNAQLFRMLRPLLTRFGRDHRQHEPHAVMYDAWVFGYHRIGWKVAEALHAQGTTFAAVDDDPRAIARLHERGVPSYFGDASDDEFLESLPLASARLVVSTIPDLEASLVLLQHCRTHTNGRARIIVTAEHARDLDALYAAGADFVMLPHLLGGVWISNIITDKPWTAATFTNLRNEQTAEMQLRTTHATA
ncbi:cation:proton antiporter [Candidatus Uhrbacteria bacterium]|nr:cation:proton antiporter [Candidatus Uhrbacteria bacterium]